MIRAQRRPQRLSRAPRGAVSLASLAALAACARPEYPPQRPRVLTLTRPAPAISVAPCVPSGEPPIASAGTPPPTAEGALSLVKVRGDDRLAMRLPSAVAFSDDGARLYAAGPEAVFVWSARTGALEATLPYGAPLSSITDVVVGASQRFVAVAGVGALAREGGPAHERVVTLLDARGGRRATAYRAPAGRPVRTADGTRVFLPANAWDLETGAWRALPALPGEPVLSPDGRLALSYTRAAPTSPAVPVLYDLERGTELHRFEPALLHRAAAFSGDGRRVIVQGSALAVYDTHTFERVARVPGTFESVEVALTHEGRLAMVLEHDHTAFVNGALQTQRSNIALWDLETETLRARAWAVGGPGWEFSRDGRTLAYRPPPRPAPHPHVEALYRVEGLAPVRLLDRSVLWPLDAHFPALGVQAMALSPDGSTLAYRTGEALTLRALDGSSVLALDRRPRLLARSPDGSRTAALDDDAGLRVEGQGMCVRLAFSHLNSGEHRHDRALALDFSSVRFSDDGSTLFVLAAHTHQSPVFRAFDAATGRERWSARAEGASAAALGADALVLQAAETDEVLRFDAVTGELALRGRPPRVELVAPLFDAPYARHAANGPRVDTLTLALPGPGGLVANAGHFNAAPALSVWDLRRPERVRDLPADEGLRLVANAPRAGHWAAGSVGGRVTLYRAGATRGEPVEARHQGGVRALAFTPDETRLVSAGEDGSIAVADVATGRVVGRARVPYDTVTSLWISPDGTALYAHTARELSARFRLAR